MGRRGTDRPVQCQRVPRGANLRVWRPDGLQEHQPEDGSGSAAADQLRAFRGLEYPSAPVHVRHQVRVDAAEKVVALMPAGPALRETGS